MAPLDDTVVRALIADGFTRLPGEDAAVHAGTSADAAAWISFARSWDALALDEYMADGGRYRRRRHAVFSVQGREVARASHQPHYQSRDYNTLNGGVERWFTPVADDVAASIVLRHLLLSFGATFAAASTTPEQRWQVEMHQFRIEADPEHAGQPTPEGMHRDGVDWVAVVMVARHNVAGGVTRVADAAGRKLGSFTLHEPLDTLLIDDHRVWHGVTPVVPLDPTRQAHRDVLVLTFRASPAA